MNLLRRACLVVAMLSIICLAGSVIGERSYAGKAKLIQRVEKNESASLFGDEGTFIGSPQRLIVDDPNAFTGKQTPDGALIVDEAYLRSHNIYPLQLQTVEFAAGIARITSLIVLAASMGVAWVLGKRLFAPSSPGA